jgi:formate C-acetyltransferase
MEEHKGKVFGQDIRKYLFYNAACIACDGIITLTKRYADIAREKAAKEANAEKKHEY